MEILGIQRVLLKVKQDFTYSGYHMRVKCQISFLAKKPLTLCNRWSTIEEPLRFLDSFETDKKKDVLMEKIDESFKFSS